MQHNSKEDNVREPLRGFRDIYGKRARIQNFVANKISEIFQKWGYDQIIPPLLEKASCFSEKVVGGSPWPEWNERGMFYLNCEDYKDNYGGLPEHVPALLIPEGTISVSRWLAKILTEEKRGSEIFPKKVFYITPCFRNEIISKLSPTKGREFTQVGVEILGTNSFLADIEILRLIHEGFLAINIDPKYELIRLGNVEIFNAVCEESKIDKATRVILKDKMDIISESRAGKLPERLQPELENVKKIISFLNLSDSLIKKWHILSNTYVDLLDKKTIDFLRYKKGCEKLNQLAEILRAKGITCVIDLSVVRSHEYYTGIVYEVDLKYKNKTFVEVAGGGRYNKLISKFLAKKDYQIPAVGFAYGLERITEFFELANPHLDDEFEVKYWVGEKEVDFVVAGKSGSQEEILKLIDKADEIRKKGKRVDLFMGGYPSQSKINKYAKARNAKIIMA